MHGGLYGALDENGRIVERGWTACGYETTAESPPERTWRELSKESATGG